ncbi:MAG: uracil-DNA glycosylase [Halobacteria archaeon]
MSKTTLETKYPVLVEGQGKVPCDYMVIGEAPGREEIRQGIPFCGPSGRLLDSSLAKLGFSRANLYITNLFKGDVGEGNRNPSWEEIDDHWEILMQEIEECSPVGILLLGKVPTKAFLMSNSSMKELVGKVFVGFFTKALWLFPNYHPAFILRNPNMQDKFEQTLSLFISFIDKFSSRERWEEIK